jgi:hypothetical protein
MCPDYSLFIRDTDDSTIIRQMFSKCFPSLGTYQTKDNKHSIEIFESSDKHIFGMFCKKDENTNGFFRFKVVTNSTQTPQEITEKEKIILEYYSFFYIDIEKCMVSVISNKKSGKFSETINLFLHTEKFYINFIPYSIDSLDKAVKKFSNIKGIHVTYSNDSSKEQFKNLQQYQDTDSIEVDSLKIHIKVKSTGSKFIEDLDKIQKDNKKYQKYKIIGDSEDGIEQAFDIIAKIFYRSAQIEILGDPEKNIKFINAKLKEELNLLYTEENL